MKKKVWIMGLICLIGQIWLGTKTASAIYDPVSVPNNRFGIHILETAEVDKAAALINSSGGDWGYVTIPIRANDRDLSKWTNFMEESRKKHLIPILRIASFPVDEHWMAPNEYDLVDFANFLNDLPWPTRNRYVIIYNEPNHKNEWGGFIYPEEYSRVLARAVDIFHKKDEDYFVVSAGLDSSAISGENSMNEYEYMRLMEGAVPGIFSQVDGISSHAYGNPGFSSFPNVYSRVSVANYRFEEDYLKGLGVGEPKIFLTEAGWQADLLGDKVAGNFYRQAFNNIWTDPKIVAITPFVLDGGAGPFKGFGFVNPDGSFREFAKEVVNIPKTAGKPELSPIKEPIQENQTILLNSKEIGNLSNLGNPGSLRELILGIFKLCR